MNCPDHNAIVPKNLRTQYALFSYPLRQNVDEAYLPPNKQMSKFYKINSIDRYDMNECYEGLKMVKKRNKQRVQLSHQEAKGPYI